VEHDRILDPEVKSWIRPYYEDLEQVEAVDKYTLRIRLKEPGHYHYGRNLAGRDDDGDGYPVNR